MIYPTRLGENGPGGYGKQWTCITAPNYSLRDPIANKRNSDAVTSRKNPQSRAYVRKPAPEGTIRLPDAAAKYGCPYKTLYYAVKAGRVKATKDKSDYIVTAEAMEDFVKNVWRPKNRRRS